MTKQPSWMERWIVWIVLGAHRAPRRTLAALAVVTLALAPGILRLEFGTGILDFLPGGNEHVRAFREVVSRVDGVTNQELIWVELDPEKAAAVGVTSITDEAAIRAQDELAEFVRLRVDEVELTFGLPDWLKLARSCAANGDPSKYSLPESSLEFGLLWGAIHSTQATMLESILSRDGRAALLGFLVIGDPLTPRSRAVGEKIRVALAEYRDSTERRYDFFLDEGLVPIGLASGLAMLDSRLKEDAARIAPLAALFLAVVLFAGFRSWMPVFASFGQLLIGFAWVFGAMGWVGVRLNLVNIALVPLLLGAGINHAIHVLGEIGAGWSDRDHSHRVLERTARGAGLALCVTTAISVGGLLALTLSEVAGMVELGVLASFGLLALWVLILTLPAAWLGLSKRSFAVPRFQPSIRLTGLLSRLGGRWWWVGAAGLIGGTVFLVAWPKDLHYQLDVIQGNFPPDDPVSVAVRRIRDGVGGAFPEFVILKGDATDPKLHELAARLQARLIDEESGLGPGTMVLGPRRLLGSYEVLKDGPSRAMARFFKVRGDLEQAAPNDRATIEASLRAMHADPAWAPLVKLCTSESLDLTVLVVMPPAEELSFASAKALWSRLELVIEEETRELPEGVSVSFLGYRTLTYLFIATTLLWMKILFGISFFLAIVLVFLFFPRKGDALVIGAIMVLTGIWWVGLLRVFGISISIFLLFPLVFLLGVGTDYGLHLLWRARSSDAKETYGLTGKAVVLSAVTDAGVFLLFVGMSVVSAAQVMKATVVASAAMFLVTFLIVPIYLGKIGFGGAATTVKRREDPPSR